MKKINLDIISKILKIIVLIFIVKEFINKNYIISCLFLLILIIFIISIYFKKKYKKYIYFFEYLFYLIIYVYEFNLLYKNIPFWDTGMHTLTGYLTVIFILLVFLYLKQKKKNIIYPFLVSFLGFCFSLSVGLVFEIYEYTIDQLMARDMQKDYIVNSINTTKFSNNKKDIIKTNNIFKTVIYYVDDSIKKEFIIENGYLDVGINDTMKDLFVNLFGSIIGFLYVYYYLKLIEK